MCGIGGILRTDGQPIPEAWLDAIDARIAYRGPDGHGRFRDRVEIADPSAPGGKRIVEVAFVHRRLSIIDHAGGHQPMVSERGRNDKEGLVAVVFNGCIYNHRELRKELEAKGHRFVTDHSDTEVLIHGWREWKLDIIAHLEGMFAFGLWDRANAQMILARDWCGHKPLYFASDNSTDSEHSGQERPPYVFASSATAVEWVSAQLGITQPTEPNEIRATLRPYLLWGYLQEAVRHDDCGAFETLRPNVIRTYPRGPRWQETVRELQFDIPWYHLPWWIRPNDWRRTADDDLERLLEAAVVKRLEADVPLGCFLSGGVDSSLVSFFANRARPKLMTFCVRMPDTRYDESSFAERTAGHLGTTHHTIDVEPRPSEDLVHLIDILGQPFGDSSILPTYWVSRAAAERVKVCLSGDGGDEMFLGYERFFVARALKRFRLPLSWLPSTALQRAHPKSGWNKLGRLGAAARSYRELGLRAIEVTFSRREVAELIGCSLDDIREFWPQMHDDPALDLQKKGVWRYLPYDLMCKVDTASMACDLEVRCPFLDRELATVALNATYAQLTNGGQRKGLLRQIARKYLPKEIVDRPKMGFAIPIGEWFRDDNLPHKGSGMKTLLLDHLNSAEPFGPIQLNRKAVQRFIDEHMSGKRDHGQRLFTLLTLSIWARQTSKRTNE